MEEKEFTLNLFDQANQETGDLNKCNPECELINKFPIVLIGNGKQIHIEYYD